MQKQINEICGIIYESISHLINSSKQIIIAIDGNCAAGKTSVARELSARIPCDVVHMDDFYLPFNLRTEEQMSKPGGNIDFGRLITEVLIPVSQGEQYTYKPYSCKLRSFSNERCIVPKHITIVEGSYSCHPTLATYYDFKVFISLDKVEQIKRITVRNGKAKADEFKTIWIPRENYYFDTLCIKDKCNLII